MELDIYIPPLHLAFEYQGEHHYHSHKLFGSTEARSKLDQQKRVACSKAHITLIEVCTKFIAINITDTVLVGWYKSQCTSNHP
jgi:hypothetical protein